MMKEHWIQESSGKYQWGGEEVSTSNKLNEVLNASCSIPMPLVSKLRFKNITYDMTIRVYQV